MEIICLDTDVLIEHKRAVKKNKKETLLYKLSEKYSIAVTVITVFELLRGDNSDEDKFWNEFFDSIHIFDFDMESCKIASKIDKELTSSGNKLDVRDVFIASICIKNNVPLASYNQRHFERIKELNLISRISL